MTGCIPGKVRITGYFSQVVDGFRIVIHRTAKAAEVDHLAVLPEHGVSTRIGIAVPGRAGDLPQIIDGVRTAIRIAGKRGEFLDRTRPPNYRYRLLDLVKRRLRFTTHQAAWIVNTGQRDSHHLTKSVRAKGCRGRAPQRGQRQQPGCGSPT